MQLHVYDTVIYTVLYTIICPVMYTVMCTVMYTVIAGNTLYMEDTIL